MLFYRRNIRGEPVYVFVLAFFVAVEFSSSSSSFVVVVKHTNMLCLNKYLHSILFLIFKPKKRKKYDVKKTYAHACTHARTRPYLPTQQRNYAVVFCFVYNTIG